MTAISRRGIFGLIGGFVVSKLVLPDAVVVDEPAPALDVKAISAWMDRVLSRRRERWYSIPVGEHHAMYTLVGGGFSTIIDVTAREHPTLRCGVCRKPGFTHAELDMVRVDMPGDKWESHEPIGLISFGCADHPTEGITYRPVEVPAVAPWWRLSRSAARAAFPIPLGEPLVLGKTYRYPQARA